MDRGLPADKEKLSSVWSPRAVAGLGAKNGGFPSRFFLLKRALSTMCPLAIWKAGVYLPLTLTKKSCLHSEQQFKIGSRRDASTTLVEVVEAGMVRRLRVFWGAGHSLPAALPAGEQYYDSMTIYLL